MFADRVVQLLWGYEGAILLSLKDAQSQLSHVRGDEVSRVRDLHAELSYQHQAFSLDPRP